MLPEPQCRRGYPWSQIDTFLDVGRVAELMDWMHGQTMTLCQMDPQREWIDDEEAPGGMRLIDVGPPLCDRPHGPVVYRWDLERFLAGGPIID